MAKKDLQYNIEYLLTNDVGSKTVTINDVDSANGVANAAAFGSDLTSYYEGDYTVDTITLVETRRTNITE